MCFLLWRSFRQKRSVIKHLFWQKLWKWKCLSFCSMQDVFSLSCPWNFHLTLNLKFLIASIFLFYRSQTGNLFPVLPIDGVIMIFPATLCCSRDLNPHRSVVHLLDRTRLGGFLVQTNIFWRSNSLFMCRKNWFQTRTNDAALPFVSSRTPWTALPRPQLVASKLTPLLKTGSI